MAVNNDIKEKQPVEAEPASHSNFNPYKSTELATFVPIVTVEKPERAVADKPFIPHDPQKFSWLATGLNWLGYGVRMFGWEMFNLNNYKPEILANARAISEIKNPLMGDMSQVYTLWEAYVNGVDMNKLPPLSHQLLGQNFTTFSRTGLGTAKYIDAHPEIAEKPLKPVVFISGLPRTGTTVLQNLFGSDVYSRSAIMFEISHMVNPYPPATSKEALKNDPRLAELRAKWDSVNTILPGYWNRISASHPSAPDYQEEELFVMYFAGIFIAHSLAGGPGYLKEFMSSDKQWLYRWVRAFFTMLNSGFAPESHWVLKCPLHTLWVDSLAKVFPTSKLVFTHRDPAETIPSYCALVESYVGHLFYPGAISRAYIGRLDQWKLAALRTCEWQKTADPKQYINVVKDPINTIKRIYEHFDMKLAPESEAAMEKWIVDNPQGKHGRRAYTPEMYGLTAEEIRAEFADYVQEYCQPPKP